MRTGAKQGGVGVSSPRPNVTTKRQEKKESLFHNQCGPSGGGPAECLLAQPRAQGGLGDFCTRNHRPPGEKDATIFPISRDT